MDPPATKGRNHEVKISDERAEQAGVIDGPTRRADYGPSSRSTHVVLRGAMA